MHRQDFDFDLPEALIAQRPAAERAGSRLMRVPARGAVQVAPFPSILEAFEGDEVLVLNDTKVVPARVRGNKESGGAVEVFVIEALGEGRVKALMRGKRLKAGTKLVLPGAKATILARNEDGSLVLQLDREDLWVWLAEAGAVPLPPYIRRDPDAADRERYQTVFARQPGAVAAPTAGLHFTDELLDALRAKGVEIRYITLHVGPGTFLPVRSESLSEHHMHSERYEVPPETAAAVASGRPVIAVGTTVVRALEAHARDPDADRTELFILPGFDFRVVDGLLTHFHLPQSTLLMLVSAFAGTERVLAAYRQAVEAELRFYSYGDAMLLTREEGRWTFASA